MPHANRGFTGITTHDDKLHTFAEVIRQGAHGSSYYAFRLLILNSDARFSKQETTPYLGFRVLRIPLLRDSGYAMYLI